MPESPRSPRNLYGNSWPFNKSLNDSGDTTVMAHAKVQRMAKRLKYATNDLSAKVVSRGTGVPETTISSIVKGAFWPTVETLARLETGLGEELWPH
ncbi:helix-turn-helix domain-containing protein [Corynebacterium cystitidis]|uniref:Helix-turn-helix n=1 Tax=Corynebacterium cystitidis DSM 20524 TaxID=1121357 RepID=A0A1H9WMJ9_9CORY|nr:helix-turn-helix transcriptional regulator [Corynebacterium cystitidis]WJY82832.1 Helix-turn-helix protein [Corynebacterium cystitidis DSM 20524]SES35130.1 Helix-turn-helix [Corynebacterium cystitidis DSM 20524]SNV70038.1 Uncharacterised protein [Corynebacterium cystitidis]